MRTSVIRFIGAVAISLSASLAAFGQVEMPDSQSRFDVAVTYNTALANVTTSNQFWMQGGSVQVRAGSWNGWGIAGNVIGLHTGNMHSSGVGLDLIAYTAGLRYTVIPERGRYNYFGEVLGGAVHGANSIFPTGNHFSTSGNSLALQMGGGINIPMSRRLALRVVEADWLRTQLPNATTGIQNNFRLGAGIQIQFQ
jgi:peptidoglycan-associated lipoprotein